jgi:tRNA U54 and U55 pseudouridine synthase Pus10
MIVNHKEDPDIFCLLRVSKWTHWTQSKNVVIHKRYRRRGGSPIAILDLRKSHGRIGRGPI